MDKAYDSKQFEEEIYKRWEEGGVLRAADQGEPYTILMPPPNANASLHAGHAMYAIDDIVIRWKRMQGYSAVWIPGVDHAGFETQFVYEKELSKQGKSRMDFDRNTLYQNIYQFVQENAGLIFQQFKRLGFSADWERSVFTLDEVVLKKVFETFSKMVKERLVYRDEYIVNFCTHCGTSLAELEVNHKERKDTLFFIDYPLVGEDKKITVATVRPETMFGDIAIAVSPKDERYKKLVGKSVELPLTKRIIPIIADAMVDIEFGTGAVKITPAHDLNDFEAGKRHKLKTISVIDLRGRMILPPDHEFGGIEGLKAKDAREKTVMGLVEKGFLNIEKTDPNYEHSVTVCYRCGRDLEPMVIPNWFIKVEGLKKHVIDAIKEDKVRFTPARFKKQVLQWLSVMHDWPISRQLVWGIRIPVWYEVDQNASNIWVWWLDTAGKLQQGNARQFLEDGIELEEIERGLQRVHALTGPSGPNYVVAKEKPEDGKMYLPETDTFDTWFSSGQWPLVTLSPSELETRLPTDFMGTLEDILKFWISRMIMFSLYETGKIPFKDVYLWSMVADSKGAKMSKSRGNVVNPIELVDKYGADAVRMSLVFGVAPGSKIPLSEEKVKGMRNFANKVWNVGRFVLSIQGQGESGVTNSDDKWILEELEKSVEKVNKALAKYRFNEAAGEVYEFVWHKFADVYIEKVKARREEASPTLVKVLATSLKLLHPFMPFVTEAVWAEGKRAGFDEFDSPILALAKWVT